MAGLPWLQPNPNNLPYCTISDDDLRVYGNSHGQRMEWPFGNSPMKGKCIPFIDLNEGPMINFYVNKCVAKYKEEVASWSRPNPPIQPNEVMV
jgi:hypothetical protein